MHKMRWEKEIEEILATVAVSDMIGFLNPWMMKITDISEEGEEALAHIFRDVLKEHGIEKTLWFAFCVGQAFERATDPEDGRWGYRDGD